MSRIQLMSVVDAAGFAMAPPEEDVTAGSEPLLDAALRNGHRSAAHKPEASTLTDQLATLKDPASLEWVRGAVSGWWGGKAHA